MGSGLMAVGCSDFGSGVAGRVERGARCLLAWWPRVGGLTLVTRLRKTMGVFPIASVTSSRILLDFAGAAAEVSCFTGAATACTRRAVRDRAPTPAYASIQTFILFHSRGCDSADAY